MHSSTETKFGGMTLGICEALPKTPIQLYCDNKVARYIAHNRVQHYRTKHVKVDMFFIKEKVDGKILELPKI